MKVSIIIPTYNEAGVIADCLTSLSKQSVKDAEVIVIDDGSSDKTLEVLSDLKKKIYQQDQPAFPGGLKILTQKHRGPGAGRNLGASRAKGDILVFVDADMTFDKDFIKNLIDPILKNNTMGTFSKDEFVSNWDNMWSRYWNINEGWEDKKRHPANYPDEQPVFRAILRSEFDRVGGFTAGGYDDDWSLSKKLGYKAVAVPKAVFYHRNPDNLTEIFNHARWVGKRKYKLGFIGNLIALIRSSLPVSILIGLYKSLKIRDLRFLVFKIVYDFGIFVGVLNYLFTGRLSK